MILIKTMLNQVTILTKLHYKNTMVSHQMLTFSFPDWKSVSMMILTSVTALWRLFGSLRFNRSLLNSRHVCCSPASLPLIKLVTVRTCVCRYWESKEDEMFRWELTEGSRDPGLSSSKLQFLMWWLNASTLDFNCSVSHRFLLGLWWHWVL